MENESLGEVTLNGVSTQHKLRYFERIAKTSCNLVLASYPFLSHEGLRLISNVLQNIGKRSEQLNNSYGVTNCYTWSLKSLNLIHEEQPGTLYDIGICQLKLGQYNEALDSFKRVLIMQQQLYGEDVAHPDTAATLNNIGFCKQNLGQHNEALGYYHKSLDIVQQL